jgi:hypothetical protein
MKNQKHWWIIMKLQDWDRLSICGIRLKTPSKGPSNWLAVFKTKKEAIEFNGGSSKDVRKLAVINS